MPEPERRTWRAAALAALLLGAGLVSAQQQPSPRLQLCMACHGPQGNSQVPEMPSLAGQPAVFVENQLVLIREGMREVPAMKGVLDGVSDAEIRSMAEYFAAQPPAPPARAADPAIAGRGRELSARLLCASCHEADYRGRQQIPRLAGQQEAFLLQSMKEFRDRPGPGRDTIMAATLRGLGDRELADLAHYLATFKP